MRQRLIKMYSFDWECISEGLINSENLDSHTSTRTDNFLMYSQSFKQERGLSNLDNPLKLLYLSRINNLIVFYLFTILV